jgi:anaerobic selenocysteine-containing dehydrogenase
VAPNQNAVRRGMMRPDLFTVVHELFFTDTTDYADYILPATTFLEHTDIQGAYGHYFVQLSQQAIEPPGEARSNVWLFGQLAQRMGFRKSASAIRRRDDSAGAGDWADGHSTNAGMEHITLEDLKRRGTFRWASIAAPETQPFHAVYSGPLPTPSGKIEFYSETLAARGPLTRFRVCSAG